MSIFKKWIVYSFIVVVIGASVYFLGDAFAPGSYPYAEEYQLEASESEIVKAVNEFKIENPNYQQSTFTDGRSEEIDDHWYHIYFKYPNGDIVYCWIREVEKNSSVFAFVALSKNGGGWRLINHELDRRENRQAIEIFESKILRPIKHKLH